MLVGNPADWTLRASDPRASRTRHGRAYVKIAEGCNRTCSFCAIPAIRGKQRSRTVDDVVREVPSASRRSGVRELNLVSQDTIAYGRDLDEDKAHDLASSCARRRGEGAALGALHYLYPETLTPRSSSCSRRTRKVLRYVDMPLQHAADGMLQAHAARPRRRAPAPRGGDAARRRSPTW
jgi:ribosomal protein S12 methylthiotransferase